MNEMVTVRTTQSFFHITFPGEREVSLPKGVGRNRITEKQAISDAQKLITNRKRLTNKSL